jgi:hypothetical protein
MARRIAGPITDPETLERAQRIAEAQIDLNRVRDSRRRLIAGFLIAPRYQPLPVLRQQLRLMKKIDRIERLRSAAFKIQEVICPEPPEGEQKLAAIIEERASQLAAPIDTNGALCRDASSRSVGSMRAFAGTSEQITTEYRCVLENVSFGETNPIGRFREAALLSARLDDAMA